MPEFNVKVAFTPLKETVVVPLKFVPRMTTLLFTRPLAGFKFVIPQAGEPSTLARNTAARFELSAEKNVKPVLVCNRFTEVR